MRHQRKHDLRPKWSARQVPPCAPGVGLFSPSDTREQDNKAMEHGKDTYDLGMKQARTCWMMAAPLAAASATLPFWDAATP